MTIKDQVMSKNQSNTDNTSMFCAREWLDEHAFTQANVTVLTMQQCFDLAVALNDELPGLKSQLARLAKPPVGIEITIALDQPLDLLPSGEFLNAIDNMSTGQRWNSAIASERNVLETDIKLILVKLALLLPMNKGA